MAGLRVAVILPAYNEQGNLTPLITGLCDLAKSQSIDMRVVVVDDASTDGTAEELEALGARVEQLRVVRHATNKGLGGALKSGMAAALSDGADAVVFMDADLSHRPEDLPKLTGALASGAAVVLGSRFVSGGGMIGVPLWRVLISRAGNAFGRFVLGVPIRDLTTGYRAFRRAVIESIVVEAEGFTIQLEMLMKAYAAGFAIVEVPVLLGTRRYGASHMNYSLALLRNYWRLLLASRGWIRASHR